VQANIQTIDRPDLGETFADSLGMFRGLWVMACPSERYQELS